jgi:general transcription factor 3C polypeptide 5 (transcription factor C subunit 1)
LLAYFTYSFESGPWRNTYVRLEYDPKSDPNSLIYQVIDFRTKEDMWNAKGPYDFTFTSLPRQQGQLYQLCDIESETIKQVLISPESVAPTCSVLFMQKKTGWLTKKAFAEIKDEIKDMYLKLKLG